MIRLFTADLLKEVIKGLKEKEQNSETKIYTLLYEKEYEILERLGDIDMTGSLEEFKERLGNQCIYFYDKSEHDLMVKKAKLFDQFIEKIKSENIM